MTPKAADFLIKRQLHKVFPGSTVSIGGIKFSSLSSISISGINIRQNPADYINIKEVDFQYSLFSLFKAGLERVSVKGLTCSVISPEEKVSGLSKVFIPGTGGKAFRICRLELSGADLNIELSDLSLKAKLSLELDLINQSVDSLDLAIERLEAGGLEVQNFRLKAGEKSAEGFLGLERIQYNKLKAFKFKSKIRVAGKYISLDPFSADMLRGKVSGRASLGFEQGCRYSAGIKLSGIDLEAFVKDFEFGERFKISGKVSADFLLKGGGADIEVLEGDIASLDPGGELTVSDSSFLESMARGSGQSLDILVESLRNYRYNIGTARLRLEQGDLLMDIDLQGDAGKRSLGLNLHQLNYFLFKSSYKEE